MKLNTNRCYEEEPCGDTSRSLKSKSFQQGALPSSERMEVNVTSSQAVLHPAVLQHQLELKIEAKLKFSQFLDEVSSRVLRSTNLFVSSRQTVSSRSSSSISNHSKTPEPQTEDSAGLSQSIQSGEDMQEEQERETVGKAYLETDIDCVRREDEIKEVKIKKETAIIFESVSERKEVKTPECHLNFIQRMRPVSPLHYREESPSRYPYRSVSLPRDINMVRHFSLAYIVKFLQSHCILINTEVKEIRCWHQIKLTKVCK